MILKEFNPDPSLLDFVQCYRIIHFKFDKVLPLPYKIYPPKPENILHFFLKDSFAIEDSNGKKNWQPAITFIGQRTVITRQFTGSEFLNFQVVFQPTAIFRLTGIPATELTNQKIDAETIFPKNIRLLFEQLKQAKTHVDMLPITDKFIAGMVANVKKETHLLDTVSRLMMQTNGNISLDMLAREACLCSKQFIRKFNERAGLNPKTFSRIIRVTKAMNIRNAYPKLDWLRIAIECGYFDYQHMVKDYKEFTGFSPNEYHLHETKSPEKILGLAEELYQSRLRDYLPIF